MRQPESEVINPTTPANLFHAVRRQLHRDIRVPLITFTPKSLLRHPECVSSINEFTEGHFRELIADHDMKDAREVKKLLLCSGKIYYELNNARKEAEAEHISIVRVEQLYPFPQNQLDELLKQYDDDVQLVWVQEEPLNMGGAQFVKNQLDGYGLTVISRAASGVTAEGLVAMHKANQAEIIAKAIS